MTTVNVFEAKMSFSKLVAAAEAGETVVIARNGKPVAQLGPLTATDHPPLRLGDLAGQMNVPDNFDEWTDDDESMWFGEADPASAPS